MPRVPAPLTDLLRRKRAPTNPLGMGEGPERFSHDGVVGRGRDNLGWVVDKRGRCPLLGPINFARRIFIDLPAPPHICE